VLSLSSSLRSEAEGGTITQRQIGVGQYINSGAAGASNPVYTMGSLSTVYLIANVREMDSPLMHVGLPVEVHVLAYPDRLFKGKISWVAPSIDPNTHRLAVRADVENPDGALKHNLVKGASGQTIQNMNVLLGLPETTGFEHRALGGYSAASLSFSWRVLRPDARRSFPRIKSPYGGSLRSVRAPSRAPLARSRTLLLVAFLL
jgi:hypothetical protein